MTPLKGLILGDSRARALKRFDSNEKSLIRRGDYDKFQLVVKEYLELGHAQLVSQQEMETPTTTSQCMGSTRRGAPLQN